MSEPATPGLPTPAPPGSWVKTPGVGAYAQDEGPLDGAGRALLPLTEDSPPGVAGPTLLGALGGLVIGGPIGAAVGAIGAGGLSAYSHAHHHPTSAPEVLAAPTEEVLGQSSVTSAAQPAPEETVSLGNSPAAREVGGGEVPAAMLGGAAGASLLDNEDQPMHSEVREGELMGVPPVQSAQNESDQPDERHGLSNGEKVALGAGGAGLGGLAASQYLDKDAASDFPTPSLPSTSGAPSSTMPAAASETSPLAGPSELGSVNDKSNLPDMPTLGEKRTASTASIASSNVGSATPKEEEEKRKGLSTGQKVALGVGAGGLGGLAAGDLLHHDHGHSLPSFSRPSNSSPSQAAPVTSAHPVEDMQPVSDQPGASRKGPPMLGRPIPPNSENVVAPQASNAQNIEPTKADVASAAVAAEVAQSAEKVANQDEDFAHSAKVSEEVGSSAALVDPKPDLEETTPEENHNEKAALGALAAGAVGAGVLDESLDKGKGVDRGVSTPELERENQQPESRFVEQLETPAVEQREEPLAEQTGEPLRPTLSSRFSDTTYASTITEQGDEAATNRFQEQRAALPRNFDIDEEKPRRSIDPAELAAAGGCIPVTVAHVDELGFTTLEGSPQSTAAREFAALSSPSSASSSPRTIYVQDGFKTVQGQSPTTAAAEFAALSSPVPVATTPARMQSELAGHRRTPSLPHSPKHDDLAAIGTPKRAFPKNPDAGFSEGSRSGNTSPAGTVSSTRAVKGSRAVSAINVDGPGGYQSANTSPSGSPTVTHSPHMKIATRRDSIGRNRLHKDSLGRKSSVQSHSSPGRSPVQETFRDGSSQNSPTFRKGSMDSSASGSPRPEGESAGDGLWKASVAHVVNDETQSRNRRPTLVSIDSEDRREAPRQYAANPPPPAGSPSQGNKLRKERRSSSGGSEGKSGFMSKMLGRRKSVSTADGGSSPRRSMDQ